MFTHSVQQFLDALFDSGAKDYRFPPKSQAKARTKKMWRLRLRNGTPIAVQVNGLVPRVWLSAEEESGKLKVLGKTKFYSSKLDKGETKGSHSNLNQIEEFRIRPAMVQITIADFDHVNLKRVLDEFLEHKAL